MGCCLTKEKARPVKKIIQKHTEENNQKENKHFPKIERISKETWDVHKAHLAKLEQIVNNYDFCEEVKAIEPEEQTPDLTEEQLIIKDGGIYEEELKECKTSVNGSAFQSMSYTTKHTRTHECGYSCGMDQALSTGDFDTFKSDFEHVMQCKAKYDCSVAEYVYSFDQVYWNLSFLANLCVTRDLSFLELVLSLFKSNSKTFEILGMPDIDQEMNTESGFLGDTPLFNIFLNAPFDTVKLVLEHIVYSKTFKVDVRKRGRLGRNMLHCIFRNKGLSNEQLCTIMGQYVIMMSDETVHGDFQKDFKGMYQQVDHCGEVPLTLILSRIKPFEQEKDCNLQLFSIVLNQTDLRNLEKDPELMVETHPLVKCITGGLKLYCEKLMKIDSVKKDINRLNSTKPRPIFSYAQDCAPSEVTIELVHAVTEVSTMVQSDDCDDLATLISAYFELVAKFMKTKEQELKNLGADLNSTELEYEYVEVIAKHIFEEVKNEAGLSLQEHFWKLSEMVNAAHEIRKQHPDDPECVAKYLDETEEFYTDLKYDNRLEEVYRGFYEILTQCIRQKEKVSFKYLYPPFIKRCLKLKLSDFIKQRNCYGIFHSVLNDSAHFPEWMEEDDSDSENEQPFTLPSSKPKKKRLSFTKRYFLYDELKCAKTENKIPFERVEEMPYSQSYLKIIYDTMMKLPKEGKLQEAAMICGLYFHNDGIEGSRGRDMKIVCSFLDNVKNKEAFKLAFKEISDLDYEIPLKAGNNYPFVLLPRILRKAIGFGLYQHTADFLIKIRNVIDKIHTEHGTALANQKEFDQDNSSDIYKASQVLLYENKEILLNEAAYVLSMYQIYKGGADLRTRFWESSRHVNEEYFRFDIQTSSVTVHADEQNCESLMELARCLLGIWPEMRLRVITKNMGRALKPSEELETHPGLKKLVSYTNKVEKFHHIWKGNNFGFLLMHLFAENADLNELAFDILGGNNQQRCFLLNRTNHPYKVPNKKEDEDQLYDHGSILALQRCIRRGNLALATEIIETVNLSWVLSQYKFFLTDYKAMFTAPKEDLIGFLKTIANKKDKFEELYKLRSKSVSGAIPAICKNYFEKYGKIVRKLTKKSKSRIFNDIYLNNVKITTREETVFLCHEFPAFHQKLGKEIPHFNVLFFLNSRYVLDELVKILTVAEIRELNSLGYQIGKFVSFDSYNKYKVLE